MKSLEKQHPRIKPASPEEWGGAAYALGAHRSGDVITFAVFSRRATRIMLEIYDAPTGQDAVFACWMEKNPKDNVFRAKLRGCQKNTIYGFRCWGPNWVYDEEWCRGGSLAGFVSDFDALGNRFNPNKVLFDPYARELSHDRAAVERILTQDGQVWKTPDARATRKAISDDPIWAFATGPLPHCGVPARSLDTARLAPKGIEIIESTSTGKRPFLPPEHAIIYEAHVRGATNHVSSSRLACLLRGLDGFEKVVSVPPHLRGTYAGAALWAPYLRAMGFTTIELLP
ncbi:MAG TPA: hypothetical protein VKP30_00140, partial [Polyangiaceae bacterium]|nr:hypothetical protein [Polyangiaceae bacterium]